MSVKMLLRLPPFLLLIGLFALVPLFVPVYYVRILMDGILLGLVAMGVNLILAHGGMLSFGHAAFYGLAAYSAAIAMLYLGIPMQLAFILAVPFSVFWGFVVGFVATRLRGIYFAILTLISAEIFYRTFWYTRKFGGEDGIHGLPTFETLPYYYVSLLVLAACFVLYSKVVGSPFGRVLDAIRENEVRARFIGYNVEKYKIAVFTISAIFPAIAGVLFLGHRGFVAPSLLSWHLSGEAVVAVFLGGVGSQVGPLVGSVFLIFLLDVISSYWVGYLMAVGIIVMLVILFIPEGISNYFKKYAAKVAER